MPAVSAERAISVTKRLRGSGRSQRAATPGQGPLSFCIGQPDFHTPKNIREAGIKAISDRQARLTRLRPGILSCARRWQFSEPPRDIQVSADDIVVARRRKTVHRLFDSLGHRLWRGRRGGLSDPGFPIYESQIRAHGAVPVPIYLRESRNFSLDPAELEAKITPKRSS